MEDIGQIILVIIAVVGAIAQQAAKAKKNREKREGHSTPPPLARQDDLKPDQDPFSWLTGTGIPRPAASDADFDGDEPWRGLFGERAGETLRGGFAGRTAHNEFERATGGGESRRGGRAAAAQPSEEYFSYDSAFSEAGYNQAEGERLSSSFDAEYDGVEGRRSTSGPAIDANSYTVAAKTFPTVAETGRDSGNAHIPAQGRTDFDLRSAVIYSEILKAKYQDY